MEDWIQDIESNRDRVNTFIMSQLLRRAGVGTR